MVREIVYAKKGLVRMQSDAILALQEASEAYISSLFQDSYNFTLHAKRITLMPQDLKITLKIRGENL